MTEQGFKFASDIIKKYGITRIAVASSIAHQPVVGVYLDDEELHILPYKDELHYLCLGVFNYLKNKRKEEDDKARHEALMEREYDDFLKQCNPTELPW